MAACVLECASALALFVDAPPATEKRQNTAALQSASRKDGIVGADESFHDAYVGKGAAVMINKNDDGKAISQIFRVIGEQYHWPDYKVPPKN
jgi:hypothetical protein